MTSRAALAEAFDEQVVSKSTVSRICEDTRERYRHWCPRRLDEHDLVYLYLDALYLKLRPDDEPAEGVVCAWGITLEGTKVLLGLTLGSQGIYASVALMVGAQRSLSGLTLGSRESYEDWLSFGRDHLLCLQRAQPAAL